VPFEPAFMARRAEFETELAQVRTPADWAAFRSRWFADQPWPQRTAEALAAARGDDAPLVLEGRAWRRAPLPDDLTPEARHAWFTALAVGLATTFPADAPGARLRYHCPACELWSDEPGPPACPACGRALLRMRIRPP